MVEKIMGYKIRELKSQEDCIKYTKHSGWCTGKTDNNHYEALYSDGFLFCIYKPKRKRPTYQLFARHDHSSEFRRTGNQSVNLESETEKYPQLKSVIQNALSDKNLHLSELIEFRKRFYNNPNLRTTRSLLNAYGQHLERSMGVPRHLLGGQPNRFLLDEPTLRYLYDLESGEVDKAQELTEIDVSLGEFLRSQNLARFEHFGISREVKNILMHSNREFIQQISYQNYKLMGRECYIIEEPGLILRRYKRNQKLQFDIDKIGIKHTYPNANEPLRIRIEHGYQIDSHQIDRYILSISQQNGRPVFVNHNNDQLLVDPRYRVHIQEENHGQELLVHFEKLPKPEERPMITFDPGRFVF